MDASPPRRLELTEARQVLAVAFRTLTERPGCVRPRASGGNATGLPCNFDGPDFVKACLEELPPGMPAEFFLSSLARLMEICKYLRHGGVRTMIYRLETGKRQVLEDYLDAMSDQLSLEQAGDSLRPLPSSYSLLARLQAIDENENAAAKSLFKEVEELLIAISRMLDPELEFAGPQRKQQD